MVQGLPTPYPGGSKSRVTKAGAAVRDESPTLEDLSCIDFWRAAHRHVLNTFQAMLRGRVSSQNVKAIVAQRHKRKATIFGKLRRFPEMNLARMDDIAGCRLIFEEIKDLHKFRESLHTARIKHRKRNEIDKYDYIKSPKPTGYRGIHDVYEYNVQSTRGEGKECRGLLIEIQYRTRIQHAWATAVELIGYITKNHPKFQEGDKRYEDIMSYASEILARAYENMQSCHKNLNNSDVVNHFRDLDGQLSLMQMFRDLNSSERLSKKSGYPQNAILIFKEDGPLEVKTFRYAPEALKALFIIEAEFPNADVVLVRGTDDDLRYSFKNYFSDASEFISLVENGCIMLSKDKV